MRSLRSLPSREAGFVEPMECLAVSKLPDGERGLSGNVSQTCRFFGVSRALFYIWKKRYEKNGPAGLRDLKHRPHHIGYRIPPEILAWSCGFVKNAVTSGPNEPLND